MKEQKGITLIALVITIIVLLILAGVTIAMLTGSNGILTNANKSNCENAYRGADEQMRLAYMTVRTEIMAQTVADSTYNPSGTKATEASNLLQKVKDDLGVGVTGSKFTSAELASDTTYTSNKKIVITYTDNAIDQGLIDNAKNLDGTTGKTPRNDTTVIGEIYLGTHDEQTASYKYDTTTVSQ